MRERILSLLHVQVISLEHSREIVVLASDRLLPFGELKEARPDSSHLLLDGLETCQQNTGHGRGVNEVTSASRHQ